jgi:LCP family protein required for cell wall assembly
MIILTNEKGLEIITFKRQKKTPGVVPRSKRKKLLFIKTLIISAFVFTVMAISGAFLLQISSPPEIPLHASSDISDRYDFNKVAYVDPEPDEDDKNVGDNLHAPVGFTSEDRKDLFYTFLIFGLDNGINTDTIMVASYDGVNKEANIISIPRDTKVNVRRNLKKINAAFPAGQSGGAGFESGVEQLKREVKTIIGFTPDFYVCVDFAAFIRIVDAVGGVEIDVPMNMELRDPDQNLYISIPKGEQHLTGEEALKFARYRMGGVTISDFQRIENQQTVIKAVLDKLLQPACILRIPEFIDIFNDHVHTDVNILDMPWFAYQLSEVRGADALSTHTLPIAGSSGLPMYYELIDKNAAVELINSTINPFKLDIQEKDLDIAS